MTSCSIDSIRSKERISVGKLDILCSLRTYSALRLDRKSQPPGLAQRPKVEGADLNCAADVDRDRDAILRHRGRDNPRPLRQQRGHVGVGCAALGLENAIG